MARDLVSAKTRLEFREHFVGTTLAVISDAFQVADIACDTRFTPQQSGQRRSLVEQYYHTLDFTRWDDVRRVLIVFEHVLDALQHRTQSTDQYQRQYATDELGKLTRCLDRDGYHWDGTRLQPHRDLISVSNIQDAVAGLDAPELGRQLARLRDSVNQDPALAIGTAKEMLETTCKTILEASGVTVDPGWDVPFLLKETRKKLKLLPEDVPAPAKGADTIQRLLSNLGQVGIGLSELRNLYGSGHGRGGKAKGLGPRHARLAVGAVSTLVQFLFETHHERQTSSE